MTAQQLYDALGRHLAYYNKDWKVSVVISSPGSVGGTPKEQITKFGAGFDWDAGHFMLYTDAPLKRTTADAEELIRKAYEEAGWNLYEMRSLKAENKRLKKLLESKTNA